MIRVRVRVEGGKGGGRGLINNERRGLAGDKKRGMK
jgi:hypothetical protein